MAKNTDYIQVADGKHVLALLPASLDAETVQRCIEALNFCHAADVVPAEHWSGLYSEPSDEHSIYGAKLMEGDTIYLLGVEGWVTMENGAWGFESHHYIPWEQIASKMPHDNSPDFCYCDNFVSFWELKWNFDDGDDWDGVPFIRHQADERGERDG